MKLTESKIKQKLIEITAQIESLREESFDEDMVRLMNAAPRLLDLSPENKFTESLPISAGLLNAVSDNSPDVRLEKAGDEIADFAGRWIRQAKKFYQETADDESKNKFAIFAHRQAIRHYKLAAELYSESDSFEKLARTEYQIFSCFNWIDNFHLVMGGEIPADVEPRIRQALKAREFFSHLPDSPEFAEIEMILGSLYRFRLSGSSVEKLEIGASFIQNALNTDTLKQDENFDRLQNLLDEQWAFTGVNIARESLEKFYAEPLVSDLPETEKIWTDFLEASFQTTIDACELDYRLALTEKAQQDVLHNLTAGGFNYVLNYAAVLAQQGKLVDVVLFLEKWRGRQLARSFRLSSDDLQSLPAPERRAYLESSDVIRRLRAEQHSCDKREAFQIYEDLRHAEEKFNEIIEKIRSLQPDFLREPVFEEIQKIAAPDKPLIYLLTTKKSTLAIIVPAKGSPQSLWFDEFTQNELDLLIDVKNDFLPMDQKLSEQIFPALENLAEQLIEYLQNELATGVYLILCSSLATLPVHAVTSRKGCLIDFFEVHFAPTATALCAAQKRLATEKEFEELPENLVAIGNPGEDLIYSDIEVEVISTFFRTHQTLIGADATLFNLEKALLERRTTHLHFACHGKFMPEDPLNSALMMANGEALDLRHILTDPNFAKIGAVRLVTLSACQTALIDCLRLPEESFGLPAGFLQANAKGVIGTLWEVTDVSTSFLMMKFYENLLIAQDTPATALRLAQIWLRDATEETLTQKYPSLLSPTRRPKTRDAYRMSFDELLEEQTPYRNPYFWGGFVLIGV